MDDRDPDAGPSTPAFSGPPAHPQTAWQKVPSTAGPPGPPEARKTRGTLGWDILLGVNMGAIGITALAGIFAYFWFLSTGSQVFVGDEGIGPGLLWFNNIWNLVVYGVIPFIWVLGTRVEAWQGTLRYLGLLRPWPAALQGVGLGALLAGIVILIFIGFDALDFPLEETGAELRFEGLTWPLIVATALIAGFAEEVFFRGILQKWIGVWGQAVVFGIMHLPAGWMAFLATGLIGLIFGLLVKKGRSLWLVIAAHASYNFILLALTMFP